MSSPTTSASKAGSRKRRKGYPIPKIKPVAMFITIRVFCRQSNSIDDRMNHKFDFHLREMANLVWYSSHVAFGSVSRC
jgi:hypothetical protein